MRSPQTTGDDQPVPGISVFHATFSVALQVSGSFGIFGDAGRFGAAELRPLVDGCG